MYSAQPMNLQSPGQEISPIYNIRLDYHNTPHQISLIRSIFFFSFIIIQVWTDWNGLPKFSYGWALVYSSKIKLGQAWTLPYVCIFYQVEAVFTNLVKKRTEVFQRIESEMKWVILFLCARFVCLFFFLGFSKLIFITY